MCHKITACMVRDYVWTYIFEPYLKKFAWQFKTEISAAVFYNSNTRCIKQFHQETSNTEYTGWPQNRQGSVATQLGCDGIFSDSDCHKFSPYSDCEKSSKIGQYFYEAMRRTKMCQIFGATLYV